MMVLQLSMKTKVKYMYVDDTNDKGMIFENVLYIPKLKTSILRLGKLDS